MIWQSLKTAVAQGNLSRILKLLKESQLPLNSPDPSSGQTLLFYSIQYHKQELFTFFLSKEIPGSRIPLDFDGNSPLMMAGEMFFILLFNIL